MCNNNDDDNDNNNKGTAIPGEVWTGPEGSRKL